MHTTFQRLPMVLLLCLLAACGDGERPATDTVLIAEPPATASTRNVEAGEFELDWLDMMPADELEALERGEVPEVIHGDDFTTMPQWGTFRTVDAVLDRNVRLPGYVVPLGVDERGRLRAFLFVPYYGACIHVPPPPPNQIVHVSLTTPIDMPDMYEAFYLSGRLRAERVDSELAGTAYAMRDARLRPYEP